MSDLRVGVVGLGGMGRVHIDCWRQLGTDPGVDVVGYDEFPEAREAGRQRLGDDKVFDHREAFLGAVDVVDICTPTDAHADIAIEAARAGRAVIVEKPLALTLERADEIISACGENEVQLHVAHVVRYFKEYAVLRAQVEAGKVGTPAVLRFSREGGSPGLDKWMHDPARSGGIVADLMIHDIDIARWVAGDLVRVYGTLLRPVGPNRSPTHAYAILTHASGAITHVTSSWAQEGVPWRTGFEIAGSAGLLQHTLENSRVLRTAPPPLAGHAGPLLDEAPWTTQLREFLAAIGGGPTPRVTADDARAALASALAVNESARTGMAVEVAS